MSRFRSRKWIGKLGNILDFWQFSSQAMCRVNSLSEKLRASQLGISSPLVWELRSCVKQNYDLLAQDRRQTIPGFTCCCLILTENSSHINILKLSGFFTVLLYHRQHLIDKWMLFFQTSDITLEHCRKNYVFLKICFKSWDLGSKWFH